MDGFYRYTAATTGNASTVFFMNIFDTQEHAKAAQEAAKEFVDEGRLTGNISPNQFTEDEIIAYFNSEECVKTDSNGLYLATRLNAQPPNLYSPGNLTQDMQTANEQFEEINGYRSFVGSQGIDSPESFFFNIYDTEDGAQASNDFLLKANADDNNVQGEIYPTVGQIKFDYLCAAGNAPAAEGTPKDNDGGGGSSSSALAKSIGGALFVVVSAMSLSLLFN